MSNSKEATTQQEREILGIIDAEAKLMGFGVLAVELIIKDGRIVRVETSTTKKAFKI